MAEVIPDAPSSPPRSMPAPSSTSPAALIPISTPALAIRPAFPSRKGGRRAKFTATDDLIIVREVSAAKAHDTACGEIHKRFAHAAEKANLNRQLSLPVTAKSIQDRYKKIQDAFERNDAADRRLSGVGGEIGELDELLGMMDEARKDMENGQKAETSAHGEREARKKRIERDLFACSLARKSARESESPDTEETRSDKEVRSSKMVRKVRIHTADALEKEVAGFGNAIKDADLARIDFEMEGLALDRERFELEKQEREKERILRREEREAQNELELQKVKMLMGAFMQFKN